MEERRCELFYLHPLGTPLWQINGTKTKKMNNIECWYSFFLQKMKYVKMKYVKMKYVKMKYVKMKYVKMKYVKMNN